jgi:hypothetical protein
VGYDRRAGLPAGGDPARGRPGMIPGHPLSARGAQREAPSRLSEAVREEELGLC